MRFFRTLILLLGFCTATIAIAAQEPARDVVYTTRDGLAEHADFYPTYLANPVPVIVYIHGGSWRSGSRANFRKLAAELAAHGYAGLSIDYDLRPHSYPLSWQQARDAVRYLRGHAAELHIDAQHIVVAGASAGGEIAALMALAPQGPAKAAASDAEALPVQAAIILSGVFDLTGSYHVIKRYLGGACAAVHDACLESSPMQHIHAGAPPFFVGHGTSDHIVTYASAELFTSQMKAAGNDVDFFSAAQGPHMYFTHAKFAQPNLDALLAFLHRTVGPA